MKIRSNDRFANSLIVATILLLFTMVLHPTGGSIEYIQKISTMLMTTHALAIISIPFWLLGFWGLYKYLEDESLFALAAFMVICVGLLAALLAATVNGIVLPLFLNHYLDATQEKISNIKPIVNYNTALNHAFDYVFMGASCFAILLWSVAILKTHRLRGWLAYFGICFSLTVIITMFFGFVFTSLTGFRIFIVGYLSWTILVIISLYKSKQLIEQGTA